uniref:Ig-like domain-containing protein n=1 Tax=Sinocyclocheilus grahami TaxID=75366 RepID=A0A672L1T0_SINGR
MVQNLSNLLNKCRLLGKIFCLGDPDIFCDFLALPITFKQNLRNQEAVEGNTVAFRCELSKPGAMVKWWRGEELLQVGEKYQMRTEGRIAELLIKNVNSEDVGFYITKEGGQAVFSCELSKPGAQVDWRKGRVILKPDDKYEMKQEGTFTKLVIRNVEASDAGNYSCKTKDSESTAELTVKGKACRLFAAAAWHILSFLACCYYIVLLLVL